MGSKGPTEGPESRPEGLENNGRPTLRSGKDRFANLDARKGSGGPPGGQGGVGMPTLMAGRGREALSQVLEGLGIPPGCPEVPLCDMGGVGRPPGGLVGPLGRLWRVESPIRMSERG